ncbi:MAG: hypothetical protein Q8K14_17880 [Hydrogenophaga sp.]|jgi:hypothetical protein|uniref:hypothetical protein n=1 Tax=Hydrogenophaga sp. TaxID=1904254 RepID=UPI0027307925|nr:hypothetical protein [Hydrogenophaga sp.]MDP1783592.1 hypothetical protein [Hydrogenophaga sp.]MDP2252294.1 hypothetical protein [Hydrogenophaga sp.]
MTHSIGLATVALATGLLTACGGSDDGPPALLSASAPTMALAVSGTARMITVTNLGPHPTEAMQASATGLPTGSWMRSTCPTQLMPGASCLLLITPGALPSAVRGDLAPVPAKVTIAGDNTNTMDISVSVLTHGSVHEGGHVFALDDATPLTHSVGGKVLATAEVASAHWSPSLDAVVGVDDDSTAAQGGCDAAADGRCNTQRILAQYPTGSRDFAAALCADSRHGGFDGWYLPAVCELTYSAGAGGLCGTQAAPRVPDNVRSRLHDGDRVGSFGLAYWSSTQSSQSPADHAHMVVFELSILSSAMGKNVGTPPSRCARAITP